MKRSPITVVAAIVALASVSLTAVAIAHTVRIDSTVTMRLERNGADPDSFAGKVISDRPRCEAERTVRVLMRVEGAPNVEIGRAVTDADGNWELVLTGDAAEGSYFALATRKVLRQNADHLHVCKRATSTDRIVH